MPADTVENILEQAIALHQKGDFAEAERRYSRALTLTPNDARLLYLAGAAAFQSGKSGVAADRLRRSLALQPDYPDAQVCLGTVLDQAGYDQEASAILEKCISAHPAFLPARVTRAGIAFRRQRWPEAEAGARAVLSLDRQSMEGMYVLANALRSQRKMQDAAEAYRQLLEAHPQRADAWDQFGAVLFDLSRLAEADAAIGRAIALEPGNANAHTNRGRVLLKMGKIAEAREAHQRALALKPESADAYNNLGLALRAAGDMAAAEASFARAVALKPGLAEAQNNLGAIIHARGDAARAMPHYKRATELAPGFVEAWFNVASAQEDLKKYPLALETYRKVIAMKPDHGAAHANLALMLLAKGDYAAGWQEQPWRWHKPETRQWMRPFSQPAWDGKDLGSGALLVWGEQGVGDEVLYASLLPDLVARGLRVVVETDTRLVPLFARSFPKAAVVARANPPDPITIGPGIAAQIAMGDLGRWLRPDAASFPKTGGFLAADPTRAEAYRRQLGKGPLVGLSWISKNTKIGEHKSVALADLVPLLQTPGATFVDLQYGDTAAERNAMKANFGVDVRHMSGLDLRDDIDGLALLIAACDLVVTVSNTTAHLAAALAVPTWVMVPAGTGRLWYWGNEGITSPWYPAAMIFRQKTPGDWRETLGDVALKLRSFVSASSPLAAASRQ